MGHLTVVGDDVDDVAIQAARVRSAMTRRPESSSE
jgi:hypothetical protein